MSGHLSTTQKRGGRLELCNLDQYRSGGPLSGPQYCAAPMRADEPATLDHHCRHITQGSGDQTAAPPRHRNATADRARGRSCKPTSSLRRETSPPLAHRGGAQPKPLRDGRGGSSRCRRQSQLGTQNPALLGGGSSDECHAISNRCAGCWKRGEKSNCPRIVSVWPVTR